MNRLILYILALFIFSCNNSVTDDAETLPLEWVSVASAPQQCVPSTYDSLQKAVQQLTGNGIEVYDSRQETFDVCAACSCPTGIVYKAQIEGNDVTEAIELGWQQDNEGDDTSD
jgi:hypothetical protein